MASSASTTSGGDERPRAPHADACAGTAPPQAHVEWAASMQAYYAAGGQPYAWHAAQSVPYPTPEPVAVAEAKSKRKSSGALSGGCTSGSAGGSEGSSDKRDATHHKVLPSVRRRKSSGANVQGEPSQAATAQHAAAESRITAKKRPATELSVSTPEMAGTSNVIVRPNLNIGMDLWTDSPVKAETSGQGEINAATHSHHGSTLSMMDERELKRERRKQSNRESARRSRLRKQQECEELAQKVTDLTVVNGTLRSELDELKKACEDMEAENSQLIGELEQSEAPSVVTTLSIQIDTTKAHHRSSDQHGNKNNTGSNG
ncbi:DNA-binding protein EMBP-1 [Zea mays]|uniref:DNA-binding protein EMBP-1 n=1 Tax=Zea mays TaxID=4577 RepID=A0A317Y388_MAIZE|nr:DNA-binding protein EMBP-1 [Zea mays]